MDYEFVTDEVALKYLESFPKIAGIDLRQKFPGTPEELINLMQRMLQFNPAKRITIEEALSDPYFDDIRDENLETADLQVGMDLAFDSENENLSIQQIKDKFIQLIKN